MSQASLFEEMDDGPFRVEVWVPVGHAWIPMDRIASSGTSDVGKWTFPGFMAAADAAQRWVDASEVLNPNARVTDAAGHVVWTSSGMSAPVETVTVKSGVL